MHRSNDGVEVYLREVRATPPLTREEERELIRRLQEPGERNEVRKRLLLSQLELVVSIAKTYADRGVGVLDLIQRGNEGLLLAVNTFSGASGGSFADHAGQFIESAIAAAVRQERG